MDPGKQCVPSTFENQAAFLSTLDTVLGASALPLANCEDSSVGDASPGSLDTLLERVTQTLGPLVNMLAPYQEAPTVLDPVLADIVSPIMAFLETHICRFAERWEAYTARHCSDVQPSPFPVAEARSFILACAPAFQVLYQLTRVRGYKTIVRFFRHDVADLEPVLFFLLQHPADDNALWTSRYVLFLWLSLLCMVPFDLQTLDSGDAQALYGQNLLDTILTHSKAALASTSRAADGAALLAGRLIVRQDTAHLLEPYVCWARDLLEADQETLDPFLINGVLRSLNFAFKLGERRRLVTVIPLIEPLLADLAARESLARQVATRKLVTKLVQRVGLTCLPPQVASWRYQLGRRSLEANLVTGAEGQSSRNSPITESQLPAAEPTDNDMTYEGELETVIDLLLTALRDSDTVVRWSAAKGVGRVTFRLPLVLAQDVVQCVLNLFLEDVPAAAEAQSDPIRLDVRGVSEATWHGACLALAELARKGLLLPDQLRAGLPFVVRALHFDVKRGSHSVGSNIRDAASYVLWSFARAYSQEVLAEWAHLLARSLIVVALFDREIHVRRAASAAFQEHVGRNGLFPHGIDLMTSADYFSLSNIRHAYLNVAAQVARFEAYSDALLQHLVTVTLVHWDPKLRNLAAEALYRLAPARPDLVATHLLPLLLRSARSSDLATRHGGLAGAGAAYRALQTLTTTTAALGPCVLENLLATPQAIPSAHLTDFGADLTWGVLCDYMGQVLQSMNDPMPKSQQLAWRGLLEKALNRQDPDIHIRATEALYWYFARFDESETRFAVYRELIQPGRPAQSREGHALALASLHYRDHPTLVTAAVTTLTDLLINPDIHTQSTIPLKQNVLVALGKILTQVGDRWPQLLGLTGVQAVLDALVAALDDYTVDNRGDIGSHVRLSAITVARTALPLLCAPLTTDPPDAGAIKTVAEAAAGRIIGSLLRMILEKIDRVRLAAGTALTYILYGEVPGTSDVDAMAAVDSSDTSNDLSSQNGKEEVSSTDRVYPEYLATLTTGRTNPRNSPSALAWRLTVAPALEALRAAVPTASAGNRYWSDLSRAFPALLSLLTVRNYQREVLLGFLIGAGSHVDALTRHASRCLHDHIAALPLSPSAAGKDSAGTRSGLVAEVTDILATYKNIDRVVMPLLTAVQLLADLGSLATVPAPAFQALLVQVRREAFKCRDTKKLALMVQIYGALVDHSPRLRDLILPHALAILAHPFPITRQLMADQLFMGLYFSDRVAGDPAHPVPVRDLLANTDWTQPLALTRPRRLQLYKHFGFTPPVMVKPSTSSSGGLRA
ncbi:hypothetical protein IWQ60_004517 [Tieghemiomyces parasiticus]|uniref:Tubulin-specific chaperone D n=1 Tax=Tieghemiomyces parasiticus TaxID=78921 RepID=A0A9W8A8Q1_9FUNG|nr:hypothetical protein IWQ60_004517 [Tieghemiomyces parasiticus]